MFQQQVVVQCLHLDKHNPGLFKCGITGNQFLTLGGSLQIQSDVLGSGAEVSFPINLSFIPQACAFGVNEGYTYGKHTQVTKRNTALAYLDHPSPEQE